MLYNIRVNSPLLDDNQLYIMRIQLFFLILVYSISNIHAQEDKSTKKFKLKKIDFAAGNERGIINHLLPEYFVNQYANDVEFPFKQINSSNTEYTSDNFKNHFYKVGLTVIPQKNKNLEWRNGISFQHRKKYQINHYNDDLANLHLRQIHDEIAIESTLLYSYNKVDGIRLYGGGGSNIGINSIKHLTFFGDNMDLINGVEYDIENIDNFRSVFISSEGHHISSFDPNYKLNTVNYSNNSINPKQFFQSFFLQTGISIIAFNRVELGIELKGGFGYTPTKGSSTQTTKYIKSGFTLRYILK